jgi:hypothetical protein
MTATNSATGSSLTGGWLTAAEQNAVIGYPSQPEWSGPVSEDHQDPGTPDPGRSGPPQGTAAPDIPHTGSMPQPDLSGGVIEDTAASSGHSAPMGPAFSQDIPFAPPGAVAPTHGLDTGGVERKEKALMPSSPGWFRRVLTGQTFNRQAQVTDNAGWNISAANNRQNLDQYQGQDADGYDPRTIPYSERPIKANFAAEAHPVDQVSSVYGVDGSLPDMAPVGGQGDFVYTTPPDPTANVMSSQASEPPTLGMEFLNG